MDPPVMTSVVTPGVAAVTTDASGCEIIALAGGGAFGGM